MVSRDQTDQEIPKLTVHHYFECFACLEIFHVFVVICRLFSELTFSKNSFRNTFRVSNSLNPDQDRHSVGPDLDPNCLQRLSVDGKSHR